MATATVNPTASHVSHSPAPAPRRTETRPATPTRSVSAPVQLSAEARQRGRQPGANSALLTGLHSNFGAGQSTNHSVPPAQACRAASPEPYRLPADANQRMRANVELALTHSGAPYEARLGWFYTQMRAGGPMDYKAMTGPGERHQLLDNLGNVNYGAVGRALGLRQEDILSAAGRAQLEAGNSHTGFGVPSDLSTVGALGFHNQGNCSRGDDPNDRRQILDGWGLADRFLAGQNTNLGHRDAQTTAHETTGRNLFNLGSLISESQRADEYRRGINQQPDPYALDAHGVDQRPALRRAQEERQSAERRSNQALDAQYANLNPQALTMVANARFNGNYDAMAGGLRHEATREPMLLRRVMQNLNPQEQAQVALGVGSGLSVEQLQIMNRTPQGRAAIESLREPLARDYFNRNFASMGPDQVAILQRIADVLHPEQPAPAH